MDETVYRRHSLIVRITHWINVMAVLVLLMSGLQIFNAHPALYWGKSSYDGDPPTLAMSARRPADGELIGVTRIGSVEFETTGVFGASRDPNSGRMVQRGFPSWSTLPGAKDLAMGRRWHFFFAWVLVLNGLVYLGYTLFSRHLRRDLAPTRSDWRGIGRSIVDHLRFRHPSGEAARDYNVLQKLAYLLVTFLLFPLLIVMGWAMSPALNSVMTGWVDLFGGRQSARTLHFIGAVLLVGFVVIHVFQVIVTGFWNNLRSMITGKYEVKTEDAPHES